MWSLALDNEHYRKYLAGINVGRTHNGYFAIDKKTKKLTDPSFKKRGEEAGLSDVSTSPNPLISAAAK